MHSGTLYVISAPSGAGKSSLIEAYLRSEPSRSRSRLSISNTTRPKRPGEIEGEHYYFIDNDTFQAMVKGGEFIEYAQVFDYHYGTSQATVESMLAQDSDLFLDIDWQGAKQVREKIAETCTIFILPPSRQALEQRLYHRGQDSQVYWVCPLIEDSEILEAEAAEQTAETLRQQLPQLIIGLVHGRMSAGDKLAVLQAFRAAEIQLLVATLVVEIGMDVPNASVMVIENAERLGLAQLHQLCGRVGRGVTASHCILLYKAPLTNSAKQRLAVLRDSQDGFAIAERDLQIRGPGELLGTRQTGDIPLRIADIIQDQALFSRVQQLAQQLHTQYPQQANALIERWLPQGAAYSNA
jgi:ATP-dependent DNA helicase RecG